MSIRKERVRVGGDMNFKINLGSNDNFLGYQQEIDNITQNVSAELINPAVDVEERRFKYRPAGFLTNLRFSFTQDGSTYGISFANAGFTAEEILYNDNTLLNSFFILDYYDTYDINTQNKILTTYLTKLTTNAQLNPTYRLSSSSQIYALYVPESYIKTNLDLGITGVTGYTKFSFYNAKSGQLILFYNTAYGSATPEKMFFPVYLDFINRTWNLLPSTAYNVTATQLWVSQEYINKTNATFVNFDNEKQNYPDGTAFDFNDGKYI